MTESGIHQKIKYGDLIYIEFTYEKKLTRNILSGGDFTIKGNIDIEIKKIDLSSDSIYLKDFEDNLFIIFPKMNEHFMNNKILLNERLLTLKEKIKTSKTLIYDSEFKNNITTVIRAFQEAKEDVYSENEKFMDDIGKPINYEDDFILIHFKTHCFVERNEANENTSLILTPNYSDECVFFFSNYNSFNLNLQYVFSNQNIAICKREKNSWNNNLFLTVKTKNLEKSAGNTNFILYFEEGKSHPFQIKICSNYIDSSSSNLTFATPVWLTVQSIDKFLNITTFPKIESSDLDEGILNNNNFEQTNINNENTNINNNNDIILDMNKKNSISIHSVNEQINTLLTNKTVKNNSFKKHTNMKTEIEKNLLKEKMNRLNSNTTITDNKFHASNNNFKISFDSTDKEKSINNINGLFYIEQYIETKDIKLLKDEYLKGKLKLKKELKMPSFVEYHKIVRFRHIISKKYLGFQEKKLDKKKTNNINEQQKGKTNGNLILMDVPNENCNWMLFESYQNLDVEQYTDTKLNGLVPGIEDNDSKDLEEKEEEEQKNDSEDNNEKENKKDEKQEIIHKIKNNEILRIFHVKTQKFLCFDEVTNKIGILNKTRTLLKEDLYNPTVEKKIYVHNLTLSNVPYDSDLIRLLPFEANQSLEISIVLYFKNEIDEEIDFITKKDFRKLLGLEDANSLQESIESNIQDKKISINNINNNLEKNINDNNIITYNNVTNKSVHFNNKTKIGANIDKINYKSQKSTIIEINLIKDKVLQLIESFKNIIDYCMNNFSRKYDINISPGKALNYRQQFLFDRGLFKKTFKYLEFTQSLSDIYNEYRDFIKKRFDEEVEAEKVRNTFHLDTEKNTLKTIQTFKKKGHLGLSNNLEFIIIELFKSINESIRLGFEFIYSMCKKNNNNKKIAFNYKRIFLYYFLEYEEASKCFMDLLKENENIMNLINNTDKNKNNIDIESESGEESNIVDKILLYLNKSKNYEPKNLSLLSKFLKLGDSGITSNQQYIFEELFYKGKKKFLIKIKPLFDDIAFKVVYKDENKNYTEKNLIEFCNNRVLAQKGIISYLAEQLNLFANLCYGRNYVCIEKIRKMFPLDHLIYHISKVDLNEEIVAGLINILNYVYIDIEPHTMNVYPSLIKLVTPNLRIERINKDKIKTYITLNKLNLILCLSLFLLNNVKYGSILVNTANINLIFNIIKFHLYENLVYTPMNISEVINSNLNQRLHNLRDEVKKNIIYGEEYLINKKSNSNNESKKKNNQARDEIFELINKDEEEQKLIDGISIEDIKDSDKKGILENINSFYNKYGYKYIELNFESPLGEEYILFVLDRINDFFLTSLILNNIDNNTEDKNIISQNFKSVTKNDILTQSSINYLMQTLIEIKNILTKGSKDLDNSYILILKQIEKVINYIMDIKQEDMSVYLIENLLKINYQLIDEIIDDNEKLGENNEFFYSILKEKLFSMPKINDILMDNEFYYYQLFNKINYCDNFPKFFLNSTDSNENQIMNALLKKDKIPEENKRMLNNSLFSEEASLIDNISERNNRNQNFPNDYFTSNLANEDYHDNEYYYNLRMPYLEINFDNFFINSVILKNLIELIIRILEMNVNGKITKILLRIFKRLMTQRSDLFSNMKNVLLLNKEEELQKYYLCNLSIKELSLLAEKTEKWMTEDHVPRRIINMQPTDNIDIKEIEEDKRDIFLVYYTIYKYLFMIIDPESNSYYEDSEVKLSQKILYSFQMENILSSLMKEIIQEYPQSESTINNVIMFNNNIITNNRYTINTKHSFIEFLRNQKRKKNKINEMMQKEKEYLYKIALEKLLKAIFKLLTALVHNIPSNINKEIIDLVEFSKEYKYLLNFGLLKLIVELSTNNKYVLYNSKFLINLINEQIKIENIKQLKEHFYDYNTFFRNGEEIDDLKKEKNSIEKQKKVFTKSIKGYSLLLKLMKNITSKITDEKNLGIILNKLVEILTEFDLFSIITPYNINNYNLRGTIILKESSIIDNIGRKSIFPGKTLKNLKTIESVYPKYEDDIYSKISYYRMVFAYYLIKIIIRLIKKNQQIKTYIFSLINIKKLIKFIFEFEPPFSETQIDSIIKSNQFRKTKIFFKNQYYFKLKYIGCSLIFHLNKMYKEKRKYIAKNLDVYYSKLKEDLDYAFYFKNRLNKLNKFDKKYTNYNIVYEKYNRHMYKYFFKGIFPLIYSYLPNFNEKLFKDYQDYKRVKNEYQQINISWAKMYNRLYEEKNQKGFKKILTYMGNKKKEYQHLFNIRENSRGSYKFLKETKTKIFLQDLEKTLIQEEEREENNLTNLINNSNRRSDIIYNITINFMNDMISEIENQEVIIKSIKREKKIMARHIKTKINFHAYLKNYLEKDSQSQSTYELNHESELHIVNIFLKFIRENVDNTKYFPVIKELIELMAYLVSVTPEIIKREVKVKKSNPNYFDQRVIEFKENFFYESQKSVLNNGTIEIFLKIASKRGKYFRENVFNIIIYFFLAILEGGNTDVQKKFIQLFQLLQNTDNFFRSINQTFDKDIFYKLNDEPFLEDISLDSKNLMVVSDKLRFLQLLTENHNLFLQNYLREQTNNRISYNFMNILIEYLSMLLEKLGNLNDKYKNLSRYYTELYYKRLLSLLDTICEFLQGPCKKNQEYLIETKIIELFNKIMEETCIISNEENEDKENNELDNYLEPDTTFYSSKKTINFDTYYGEGINYKIATNSTDDFMQDENIKQKKIFSPLSDYEKSTLLFKISLVLLSMIEGRKVKDEVIKKILRDLNYKLVFEKCGEIYTKLTDEIYFFLFTEENTKDIEDLDDKVVSEAGFNLYFLMETLVSLENEETELKLNSELILQYNNKYDKVQKEKIQEIYNNSEIIEKAVQFYSENSIYIEILKDNVVFKVYCPKLPFFNEFDEKMKKKFDEKADRNSVQTKLTSLINEKDQIYVTLKQINFLEQKYKKLGPLKYLFLYHDYVQLVGLLLIVIMNILITLGYNAEKDKDNTNVTKNIRLFNLSNEVSTAILHILGIIILCFNIIIFIEFIFKDAVIIYKNLYRNYLKSSYEDKIGYVSEFEIHRVYNFLKTNGYSRFFNKLFIYIKLIFNFHVLYRFCYMVFAILGLFVHHFFFAFHLIEFIKSQPILRMVFLVFYKPLAQLISIYIFFFILIYFYSLLIYYRYYDLMPINTCNSPLICMMYIYSNTFSSGGNLGNFIDTNEENINYQGKMERYILDISYTLIMVSIVWQEFSGLIFAAFDSLRGEREELEKDMETTCFICGLDREKIEKYYVGKDGFGNHLQDHSVNNYFFYMFYLEEKDPNEYSGLESYVKKNIDKESIAWFPIGRSLKIEEWENKHKI